jgi:outer membrane protein assembly factor BamB
MFFTSMSPLVKGGVCVVQLGGPGNGAMIAYDLGTGDEKWRWAGEGPDYGSPVLLAVDGTVQVVTPTEKSIVGVNLADGKLLWNIPFVPQRRAYNAATPIVDGNRVIYTGAGRGTTAVKIEKKGDTFVPTQVWSNPEVSVQFNTPVLKDGLLFGYSSSGYLFCLDALDGGTAWIDTVNHDRSGFASILDAGQVVVALPASGEMIILEPVKVSYTELGKLEVADLPTYAHPVISGNRLFIRDEKTVTLWTLK